MRRRAWAIADRQGLGTTEMAEYVALTQLQADALVTADERLLAAADGLVPILDPLRLGKSRCCRRNTQIEPVCTAYNWLRTMRIREELSSAPSSKRTSGQFTS